MGGKKNKKGARNTRANSIAFLVSQWGKKVEGKIHVKWLPFVKKSSLLHFWAFWKKRCKSRKNKKKIIPETLYLSEIEKFVPENTIKIWLLGAPKWKSEVCVHKCATFGCFPHPPRKGGQKMTKKRAKKCPSFVKKWKKKCLIVLKSLIPPKIVKKVSANAYVSSAQNALVNFSRHKNV
mgnify:CR=1 FL=1